MFSTILLQVHLFYQIWSKEFGVHHQLCFTVTYLLTYSMVQSPSWEANWFAASQEIPRILWNPKVHYRTHKRPPPVPILDQLSPVHIPTSHILEIYPNIIHPSIVNYIERLNPYKRHLQVPLVTVKLHQQLHYLLSLQPAHQLIRLPCNPHHTLSAGTSKSKRDKEVRFTIFRLLFYSYEH